MLENLMLSTLDLILTIPQIIFVLLFDVLPTALWVIIPLFILNKLTVYFFGYSIPAIIQRGKK